MSHNRDNSREFYTFDRLKVKNLRRLVANGNIDVGDRCWRRNMLMASWRCW